MLARGMQPTTTPDCTREPENTTNRKYTVKNRVMAWRSCRECFEEFSKNPKTSAVTPFGLSDLEWETLDDVVRAPLDENSEDDRTSALRIGLDASRPSMMTNELTQRR